jgi:hypothetical protein
MKQLTFFIEQIKKPDGAIIYAGPSPIRLLEWAQEMNERLKIERVAVFKVYVKSKPVMYEYDLKESIVE